VLLLTGDGEIMESPARRLTSPAPSTIHARFDRYLEPVGSSRFPLFLDKVWRALPLT
jgi:hypothetical protein